MTGGWFDPHRPPIRTPPPRAGVDRVEIDTLRQHACRSPRAASAPTACRPPPVVGERHRRWLAGRRSDATPNAARPPRRSPHRPSPTARPPAGCPPPCGCCRRASPRSRRPWQPRPATVTADRRHRDRTCDHACPPQPDGASRRLPSRSDHAPHGRRSQPGDAGRRARPGRCVSRTPPTTPRASRRSPPDPSRSHRTPPRSGRSARRAAPTDTPHPTPAGTPSTTAHQERASARRRFAPSTRSPHENATAGHPTVMWSGGTLRPSSPATPDAAGHRSSGPGSSIRTVRHSPPPPGPRRHDTQRGPRRPTAPTTPTTTSAPTTSHRTPPPPAPHDPTTSPDSRTATPTTSHCSDHGPRAGLAGPRS